MTTSTAMRAQGSTIALSDAASPEVYTAIPNVSGFGAPSPEAPDIPVTDLTSDAAEFLVGLVDNGEIAVNGFYSPNETLHGTLRGLAGTTTLRNFRITLADVSPQQTITFAARVKAFRVPTLEVDGAVPMEIVLRISGAATWS